MKYDTVVVDMYKKGHSIDFIIDYIYKQLKRDTRIINLTQKKIILIENKVKKNEVRGNVYKVIYNYILIK